jgi:hypothetical protein
MSLILTVSCTVSDTAGFNRFCARAGETVDGRCRNCRKAESGNVGQYTTLPATFQPVQATLVIRDLTLRVFAIPRFRGGKKAVRKLYSNFAVTVYGGGVNVWRAH